MKEAYLWYGFLGTPYAGPEPNFFDPKNYDWAAYVEIHWQEIMNELNVLFDDEQNTMLKPYFEDKLQYPPANWKTESFCYWGKKNHRMCRLFPQTYKILKGIPGLVSASVNLLEPGSKILPHFGDTNGIYRCHLGMKIPGTLPECGFTVGGEARPWQEGKLLIFLDAFNHEAQNLTTQKRYILLFDVVRPEFAAQKYKMCTHVLAMLSLYWILNKFPSLTKLAENWSERTREAFLIPLQIIWWLYLPIQNSLMGIFR